MRTLQVREVIDVHDQALGTVGQQSLTSRSYVMIPTWQCLLPGLHPLASCCFQGFTALVLLLPPLLSISNLELPIQLPPLHLGS